MDGAAMSRAVAETESVETQHTSHTVAQQTHLYKTHTQTNSARISAAFSMQSTLSGKYQDCMMTAQSTGQPDSQ